MLKKIILSTLIGSLMIAQSMAASSSDYKNIDEFNLSNAKAALIKYHNSGDYNQDMEKVAEDAISYIRFRITNNNRLAHPKKLAMVIDIDETALSNFDNMQHLGFGGTLKEIKQNELNSLDLAIPAILHLYQFAEKNNITVFFITGRNEYERKSTEKNLKTVGYDGWQALYMKPHDYQQASIVPFKQSMREKIERSGYDIVVNIGDQQSDLKGDHADMPLKLPNPFYYIK